MPSFNVTLGGQTVRMDSRVLPLKLPRGTDPQTVITGIQAKITSGEQLYAQILSGAKEPPCTTKDMTDLGWFLQAKCESKLGENFRDGAMTLPDPGGKLQNFLDSHPKAYQRESSHINAFQKMPGGTHRGIDARGSSVANMSDVMPYGLKTMLFGKLSASKENGLPENRLYIKMEVHGCPSFNKAILSARGTPYDTRGPGGNFKRTWADFKDTLGHTFNFLIGNPKLPSGATKLGACKERLPSVVTNGFKSLQKMATDGGHGGLSDILNAGAPTNKSNGIRVMYANAQKALAKLDDLGIARGGTIETALKMFIDGVRNNPRLDNIDVRFGEEVVFSSQDLGLAPNPLRTALSDLRQNGRTDVTMDRVLTSLLESPELSAGLVSLCERDYTDENARFLVAVTEMKAPNANPSIEDIVSQDSMRETAGKIIDMYIRPGSPKEINIDGPMRDALLQAYNSDEISSTMFDEAFTAISGLIVANNKVAEYLQELSAS